MRVDGCPILAQARREVSQSEERRINFLHEFAVRLGFVADGLPLWVIPEGFPVGGRRFAARMLKNVDQRVALLRLVEWSPVSHAFHSMPVKDLNGVLAEAPLQVAQFPRSRMIDA